jgi:hypothetical protein
VTAVSTSWRTVARWVVPAAGLAAVLALIGCSAVDDPGDPNPEQAEHATAFCVAFPTRDAGHVFTVPDDPSLEGNTEVIGGLMKVAANGLTESAPSAIRPAVDRYVAALRGYQIGTKPMDDPALRAAVDQIDAWLAENCPAPPATTPDTAAGPGTTPGTTG